MIISELNYLESAEAEVLGGKGININSRFKLDKDVDADVKIDETFKKTVKLDLGGLSGNGAEVLGSSDAQGNNTFTSIIFGTQTEEYVSESFVNASSFTN
ncbi:MAG: hypothetical protein F6K22_25735 [Okeania sp. SIO2F4]|uniref:hypothetical protein n=1 Tax=Okeania sp. SIO2F4 TaxID=2607790 RepID=UPI00142C0F8E|nr:hypothetical protein [Okeania sp. SIO2F4]NES05905.1 hypothetical protein [Okeania sp. SIO2F4]NES05907.1 hypothetical protein [Okeania sp. SIO2F4]